MGGSEPHFPRVLEANPHFPDFFSKSSLFILAKVHTRDIGLPDFWLIMRHSNNEYLFFQIPRFYT